MVAASSTAVRSEERGHLLSIELQKVHEFLTEPLVLRPHVRQGASDLSHPPSAANAVRVDINRRRQIKLYHKRDVRKVQASSHDVGGHEHLAQATAEAVDNVLANLLLQFAMKVCTNDTVPLEAVRQVAGLQPSIREDHHLSTAACHRSRTCPQHLQVHLQRTCTLVLIRDPSHDLMDAGARTALVVVVVSNR